MSPPLATEALRQQNLLGALWLDGPQAAHAHALAAGLQPRRLQRGLAAYRAHAGALAERALAAAYPVLQQLLGEESFAALARDFWRQHPPTAGDITQWGAGLPAFIAAAATLADEAYLPDAARLEWALHGVQTAPDAPEPVDGLPPGLQALGSHEPAALRLHLAPGTVLLASRWPVFSLWLAHQLQGEQRFDAVRLALAEGRAEQGLVTRRGWVPKVRGLPADEARYIAALLAGQSLAAALQEAGGGFDFEAWLIAALQQQLLVAVSTHLPEAA